MFPIVKCFFLVRQLHTCVDLCSVTTLIKMSFNTIEYTDMIIWHGMTDKSVELAARIYAKLNFLASGILSQKPLGDVSYERRKQEVSCGICETTIHRYVATSVAKRKSFGYSENPGTSVCRAARALGLPRCTVHRTLRRNNLWPYHYQRVHYQLLERDKALRVHFCEDNYLFFLLDDHNAFLQRLNINKICARLLVQYRRNASFSDYILWLDEPLRQMVCLIRETI